MQTSTATKMFKGIVRKINVLKPWAILPPEMAQINIYFRRLDWQKMWISSISTFGWDGRNVDDLKNADFFIKITIEGKDNFFFVNCFIDHQYTLFYQTMIHMKNNLEYYIFGIFALFCLCSNTPSDGRNGNGLPTKWRSQALLCSSKHTTVFSRVQTYKIELLL